MNLTERLLFAQVVYEVGSGDWVRVLDILSKHPLIKRPKNFFSIQSCQSVYLSLMEEIGEDL